MDTSDGGGGRDPDAGAGSSDGSGEILGLKGARAGAEAALAGRFRYPEPVYHVVRGYPELQTQEAPAPSSRILPSQERYRGVWCACAFFKLAELVFGHCLRRDACRGGPGPSPIGHAELELMVAICDLLESSSRTATHFANPLFPPALQGLREPLQDYVVQHP